MRYVQYRVPARRPLLSNSRRASLRGALAVATTCAATIAIALTVTAYAWSAKPGEWALLSRFG